MKKFVFFLIVFYGNIFAQSIDNVKFIQDAKTIVITYDLNAPESELYDIRVEISQDGGISFYPTPKAISGDCGLKIKPGKDKKIEWDVLSDVPELDGSKFLFKVIGTLSEQSKGGIPTWVWIGGGVAVAGGVTAILLSSKKTSEVPDLPDGLNIPWPPKK